MNTEKQINLSDKFQVYEGRELIASCKTVEEARAILARRFTAYIVYPGCALAKEAPLARPAYNRGAY